MEATIKLTQYAKASGCGCKIAPAVLEEIISSSKQSDFVQSTLMVSNASNDDAAIIDLGNNFALVQTADFFTPIVNDPFIFGKAAAANALSDVYAMGAKPISAIALLGWPIDKIPAKIASRVLEGANEICAAIGLQIAGGHTIESAEPFFGLSVNGLVEKSNIKRNNTAKVGDLLFLNKKLGTGILSAAHKREQLEPNDEAALFEMLCKINSIGEEMGKLQYVHAMTDVTGFGLLGHLEEMVANENMGAIIHLEALPTSDMVQKYIDKNILPDASYRNWNAYSHRLEMAENIDQKTGFFLLADPQTNGGLLVSIDPQFADTFKQFCQQHREDFFEIGRIVEDPEKKIKLEN